MSALRSLLALALIVLLVLFGMFLGIDNAAAVPLNFFGWRTPPAPIFIWVAGALAMGGVLGFSLAWGLGLRRRVQARRLQRDLDASRKEVKDLRQIVLEG